MAPAPLVQSSVTEASPTGPFTPGDELTFGQAFKAARQQGVENFLWRGSLFNTRYKGESEEAWLAGRKKSTDVKSAKQKDLKESEAGKAVSGGLLEEINEKLDLLFSLNEALISEQFGSLGQVQDIYQQVANQASSIPGGSATPEADIARHVGGAREATLQAGFFPTLLGSQGHELKTLVDIARRSAGGEEISDPNLAGPPLTAGRYAAESAQDIVNNLIGQAQGVEQLLGISGLAPQQGVSIDYPGTRMAQVGQGIENIANKVAQWLRPGGLEGQQ